MLTHYGYNGVVVTHLCVEHNVDDTLGGSSSFEKSTAAPNASRQLNGPVVVMWVGLVQSRVDSDADTRLSENFGSEVDYSRGALTLNLHYCNLQVELELSFDVRDGVRHVGSSVLLVFITSVPLG